jgi:3-oxoadipate enol-lactonase
MPVSVKSISSLCQHIDHDQSGQGPEVRGQPLKTIAALRHIRLTGDHRATVNGGVARAVVNGLQIGYDDTGEDGGGVAGGGGGGGGGDSAVGPALVLVHGHPFDRSMWRPQVAEFGRDRRVVAPDLRGYGETTLVAGEANVVAGEDTAVSGKTPLSTFAADLAALLDHLGLSRFVLGGLSMGGQIVMECYRQFPDRIAGLLLADTFPRPDDAAARTARVAAAARMEREGTGWYTEANLAKMIAPYNVSALPDVAAHVRGMMLGAPPAGAAAALRGRAERPDYRPLLASVTVPTLVVVGADDEFTPVGDAIEMHELLPDSTLAVIEGAAHMPNLEQPAAFNAALRSFLDRVP